MWKTLQWMSAGSLALLLLAFPDRATADPVGIDFLSDPQGPITLRFDDLTDGVIVTGLEGVTLRAREPSVISVTLRKVLVAAAGTDTSRSFALLELEFSDGPAGSISDIITFRTFQGSRDYQVEFISDSTEGGLTGGPFYGTRGETERFLTIPLPTDAPAPANVSVLVRSDAPIVPEPSTIVLLGTGVAVLQGRFRGTRTVEIKS